MRSIALFFPLLLAACSPSTLRPHSPSDPTNPPDRSTSPSATRPPPAEIVRKEVVEKRDLNRLVARDGTMCTVSDQVFQATRIGERVVCLWRPDSL